jgi:hypothetical protein
LGYNHSFNRDFKLPHQPHFYYCENEVTETNNGIIQGALMESLHKAFRGLKKDIPLLFLTAIKRTALVQNMSEISKGAIQPNAQPGDIRFVDLNADGVIMRMTVHRSAIPSRILPWDGACK